MSDKKKNGLTISIVIDAESANYGEGVGNITTLKKMSRSDRRQYTYISRQALRYNMMKQLSWDNTPVSASGSGDKKVVQFAPDASIKDYPEIDLFGYLKTTAKSDTEKGASNKRAAVVRLSNAISMEPFNSDLDYLTNMGLASRCEAGNAIAQSEIHHSLYAYTITIDLDRVGIDGKDGEIKIPDKEKAQRVKQFLDAVEYLYRDIKGRRENLNPVFVIGGTYERKNPYFENRLKLGKRLDLDVNCIKAAIENGGADATENTQIGCFKDFFANEAEIKEAFGDKVVSVVEFFDALKKKVDEYYE